jgi:hypothetical protein
VAEHLDESQVTSRYEGHERGVIEAGLLCASPEQPALAATAVE